MTFTTAVLILFTSLCIARMCNWSVIHGIKRKPHLSVVWNWYHFVAIAILHQPRPTDSADINTRLQLSDTSAIPPMHGGFLLSRLVAPVSVRLVYFRQCYHAVCNSLYMPNHHHDVIKWKHFPRYWPFVRGIHRAPVNSPHKGQWRGALMFSLIYARINGWVNNREAGDLRRHRAHYDVMVMVIP